MNDRTVPLATDNPLLDASGLPLFDAIRPEHVSPALDVLLADAPFWTPSQATLLREELLEDADWAEVIDRLNSALRAPRGRS